MALLAEGVPLEVPIWLRSRAEKPKWVSGITSATTCGDVLASVLRGRGLDLAEHVLVEQWRGVERPLPNGADLCQIWAGWGEERDQVRLIVKRMRIRGTNGSVAHDKGPSSSSQRPPSRVRNKVRRRNSNGSAAASVKQASDTVHPRKMRCSVDGSALSRNIEDMMQIIAAQGRVISEELNMMSPDCATTSSSQQPRNLAKQQTRNLSSQQPHNLAATSASRSYDAGLNRSTSKASAMRSLERPRKRERSEPALNQRQATSSAEEQTDFEQELDETRRLVTELTRLSAMNDEIAATETKLHLLSSNLGQLTSAKCTELTTAESEAAELRRSNREAMEEVERNRGLLEEQEAGFRAKREAVKRLEYDVNVIEKEGRKLHKEYEKVMKIEIPEGASEDGLLRDEQEIYTELKELQLRHSGLPQGDGVADGVRSIEIDERLRDSTSGSPAEDGSTSGVSSGEPDETDQRETSEEPSLLSSTKDVTKNCKSRHVMPSANKFKSKTSAAAGEDSDTGLSSLHSSTSSDDGNNTVVNSTVGNSSKDGGVTGIAEDGDFGTLV